MIWVEVNHVDSAKRTNGHLPAYIPKSTSDLSFSSVTKLANEIVQNCVLSVKLQLAVDSPVFKSDDAKMKRNFRPFSVLSPL